MGVTQERLERFEANRPRLFGLAYRLLGEASEAEDVVQDAYLRWERDDMAVSPEAWLTKVVTNLCLNRLTSARAQREQYVGTWLPEPVFTDGGGAHQGAGNRAHLGAAGRRRHDAQPLRHRTGCT